MSNKIITKAKFLSWLKRQPNNRRWEYMDINHCVVCSFIRETTKEKNVIAGGSTVDIGDSINLPLPEWLSKPLMDSRPRPTAKALKKKFGITNPRMD